MYSRRKLTIMPTLQALIFDVDGTLADTERDGHRPAFNHAFKEAGLDWVWSVQLYGELLAVTGGKERIRHYVDRYCPNFERPADFDAFVAGLHQAKTHYYTSLLANGEIPMRPGAVRLLHEARADGLRLAIATTTTPANVEALLRYSLHADSLDWFEVIAAGDMVPAKKPAADIYQYALRELGLPASACLALEDSRNGILSSTAADLDTVVAVNDYTRGHDFSAALLVVDHWGEPEMPFHVLRGEAHGAPFLDIGLLRRIHADAQRRRQQA